jgi:XTP/dITP diphosphohydrolase
MAALYIAAMAETTVLLASNNAHKVQEFREIFQISGLANVALVTPNELKIKLDPEETANTYRDNAQIKARAFVSALQRIGNRTDLPKWVLSDDSGLEVDALDGRPGVLSARYHKAAPNHDGCAALLKEMSHVADANRTARFRCVIVLSSLDAKELAIDGVCEGRIAREKRGVNGFGFDPVFLVDETRTMAELPSPEKHLISHRGIAARNAMQHLKIE